MVDKKDKSKSEFEFVRLAGDERRIGDTLASVSRHWQGQKESFLFISPHDDDVALGSGLLIQLARRENIPVYILITTDGAMGYCSKGEKDTISEIRKQESYACYESLGVPRENIIWMGFPDCQLSLYKGRRAASDEDMAVIEGYTGLQNAFTYWLRKIKPSQCFMPTSNDLHPDHKIVHEELLISLFHSAGSIWPELGDAIEKIPYVHELGVYCDFPSPPRLRMKTSETFLEKKLDAIAAFKSQTQIGSLIDIVRKGGPFEYLRPLEFKLYQPSVYHAMFETNKHTGLIR